MLNPILGIFLVLAILGSLLGGLRAFQWWANPHPELVRKCLHVGMGLSTLCFPWIFQESWPVILLAGLSIVTLLGVRFSPTLNCGVGEVVGGVRRYSFGELYFPVAVTILFVLYNQRESDIPNFRILMYLVPLLLLTVADAVAALVGVHYGQWRYSTSDGWKSYEGSCAFFLCSFLCIHLPLLLLTNLGRVETVLIALLLAWLATLFEAISWAGLDNLILPLATYLLLDLYSNFTIADLLSRLAGTGFLMAIVLIYAPWTTLIGSAYLGAFLVGYVSWALEGWRWLLPPLILFLTYPFLSPRTERNSEKIHNIHAVLAVSAAGLVWLFLARIFHHPEWLSLFTLAFAAALAITGVSRLRFDYPALSGSLLMLVCVIEGWAFQFIPYLLLEGGTYSAWRTSLFALPAIALAVMGFYLTQPNLHDCPLDSPRWIRQAAHAGLASSVGLIPIYLIPG